MLLSGCMKNSTELSLNKGYLYARTDLKIILTSSYNNSNSWKNKSFSYRKINGVQGNYDDWQLYRPLFIICKNRAHELYVCGGCFVNFSLIEVSFSKITMNFVYINKYAILFFITYFRMDRLLSVQIVIMNFLAAQNDTKVFSSGN